MPEPLYDVVVKGVQSAEPVENIIKQIAELLHNHSKAFEFQLSEALIFNQNHTSVRESVPQREAEILQQQLQKLGVVAELQAALQLTPKEEDEEDKGVYTCPACEHQQPKAADDTDTCEMCGIVGSKYQGYRKRQKIVESEKRRLTLSDQLEARRMREQAEFNEEEQLRTQARKQLGLKKSWLTSPAYLSALGAVIVIAAGIFLYPYLPFAQSEESENKLESVNETAEGGQGKGLVLNMPEGSGGGITVQYPGEGSADVASGEVATTRGDEGKQNTQALNTLAEGNTNTALDPMQLENTAGVDPNAVLQNLAMVVGAEDNGEQPDELQALLDVSYQKMAKKMLPQSGQQSRPNISIAAFAQYLKAQGVTYPFHRPEAVVDADGKAIEQTGNTTAENLQHFAEYLQSHQYKRIEDLIRQEHQPYVKALFISELLKVRKKQNRIEETNHWLDKISALYSPQISVREQALILGLQAKAYAYVGNHKQAESKIQDSIEKAEELEDASTHTALFCQLAGDQIQGDQVQAADRLLQKAYQHTGHANEGFLSRSENYANLAIAFAFIADFKEAKFVSTLVEDAYLFEETKKEIALIAQELNIFMDKASQSTNLKPVELINKVKQNKDEHYQNAIINKF